MTSPNGTRLRPDDVVGARLIEWATHIIERNDPTLRVVRDSSGLLNHGDEMTQVQRYGFSLVDHDGRWWRPDATGLPDGAFPVWRRAEVEPT
jgi:hypothetical protein